MKINLSDLGMAYRKAKVDVYNTEWYSAEAIVEYEENLENNLRRLLTKIQKGTKELLKTPHFLGNSYYISKPLSEIPPTKNNKNIHIIADSTQVWDPIYDVKNFNFEFRQVANVSWDFHVLSTLWILKVGIFFDKKLDSCVYANRLNKGYNLHTIKVGKYFSSTPEINWGALGNFMYFSTQYQKWQNDALTAINQAIKENKKLIVFTSDIKDFYPSLNPNFMLSPEFIKKIPSNNAENDTLLQLHQMFIDVLIKWAKNNSSSSPIGLPQGLPASGIIANVALIEFDNIIKKLNPIYYGRYVDDIILVLDYSIVKHTILPHTELTLENIFNLIASKSTAMKVLQDNKNEAYYLEYCPQFLNKSPLLFTQNKSHITYLNGHTGKECINKLQQQIKEHSSEWHSMPDLPDSNDSIADTISNVVKVDGDNVDDLRHIYSFTIKRATFALKLREMERLRRALEPNAWKTIRHVFLKACIDHIFVLPNYFEFERYLPRIIKLAIACEDFYFCVRINNKLNNIKQFVKKEANKRKIPPNIINTWMNHIDLMIKESIIMSFPRHLSPEGKKQWQKHKVYLSLPWTIFKIQQHMQLFFIHDISLYAYKTAYLNNKIQNKASSYINVQDLLYSDIVSGLKHLLIHPNKGSSLPYGFAFPTRPFNLLELFQLNPKWFNKISSFIFDTIYALRGYKPFDNVKYKNKILYIGNKNNSVTTNNIHVAMASWEVSDKCWSASLNKKPDMCYKRYRRFCRLINSVRLLDPLPIYFVMPELAIPMKWFMEAAPILHSKKIAFISGVEYIPQKKNCFSNEVFFAFPFDYYSPYPHRQSKQNPAIHEQDEAAKHKGAQIVPNEKWVNPPIICHNGIFLSTLICNELTNIVYRAFLRGKIDILFIPSWNQDTKTYDALASSAALDLHAFIAICNNRQYGDTRIRAPYKDDWRRDVIRVKGGMDDFVVIASLEVDALRHFQILAPKSSKIFKPLPTGFKMADKRKK